MIANDLKHDGKPLAEIVMISQYSASEFTSFSDMYETINNWRLQVIIMDITVILHSNDSNSYVESQCLVHVIYLHYYRLIFAIIYIFIQIIISSKRIFIGK